MRLRSTPFNSVAFCLLLSMALISPLHAEHAHTIKVGVYQNPPKILSTEEQPITGILGDLLREISRAENWRLEIVACEWQQCLDLLQKAEIDLLPDVAYSEERAESMDFHQIPALHSWSQLYQGDGSLLNAITDLEGKNIAVLKGSIQQNYLADLTNSFGVSVNWVMVDSLTAGFDLVENGEVDAVVSNHRFGDPQAMRRDLRPTPIIFQPAKLHFASRHGRMAPELATIDRYLQRWQAQPQSVYYQILDNWQGKPATRIPAELVWTLGLLSLLLTTVLLFNILLRRKVNHRTRELKASEEKLSTILNSVDAYIYIKDPELRYQYVNHKVATLLRCPAEEIIGKRDEDFFDSRTSANLIKNDRLVLDKGARIASEETNSLADGTDTRTFLSVKLPLRNADGSIYALCGISTDITEYRDIQEEMHRLAFFDPLTQLPNRRLLLDRLRHALAQHARTGHEGALLFIDLDNFKYLNDSFGHEIGDHLLKQVAERLGSHMRATDTLARIGGDEFVMLLESLSQDSTLAAQQAEQFCVDILQRLNQPYRLPSGQHASSGSIGLVMFSDGKNNPEELLQHAELAMYETKKSGRNGLRFFNPVMQAEASRRAHIEADLRNALAARQFELHFQPQVNAECAVIGMEALLRWQHPEQGLIPPGVFIPIAEASGLIIPIGDWVLAQACQVLERWASEPSSQHLVLAVNISPQQFRHPSFVEQLLDLLNTHDFPPERLELELTEGLLIDNLKDTAERMQQLRNHGVRFSLDDFGTGYASLGYLKNLPLFQLKIDQSFVHDLLTSPNDAAIVSTIVALGQSLDLRVIAEGVETEAQRDCLHAIGCRYFQGYLFGKPGPLQPQAV